MGQLSRSVPGGRDAAGGQRGHAVVLGAGMAGLLAARVLAGHFEQVTVVDRDRFPDRPAFRRGVPQSRHLHVLLGRGLECLEQLFPGFETDLVAAGAAVVEGSETLWMNAAGWCRRYRSPIRLLGASRELVEWQARTRVTALANVRVLEGCEAVGLLADRGRGAVTGVRLRPHPRRGDLEHPVAEVTDPDAEVAADFVVDASGRSSRAPHWLADLGYLPPTMTRINSLLGYASRQYRIPAGFRGDWRMLVINAKPPGNPRAGALVPIEGGRWMVALIGAGRDYPPTDDAGFLEFARGLRSPLLYETIREAEPLSPIYSFRNTDNQRRHFERLRRWPDRFVVVGDASCTFNPVYAQGMTVTAMTAVTLDHVLAEHRRRAVTGPAGLARRAQRQVARTNAGAWTMATTEDLRYPWTEGARTGLPTRVMHRYADRVLEVANGNPRVNTAFVNVVNLRHPPATLLRPRVLLPVLARHRAPPLTTPPTTRHQHPYGSVSSDIP
jgi:2-polyprenyl-6-methoxyphenol hydroxylase-like FAD-dependent oxidoreductase